MVTFEEAINAIKSKFTDHVAHIITCDSNEIAHSFLKKLPFLTVTEMDYERTDDHIIVRQIQDNERVIIFIAGLMSVDENYETLKQA